MQSVADDKIKMEGIPSVTKILFEDDKYKAQQTVWQPGAFGQSVARDERVVLAIKGGTLTRIYPDGKNENVTYRTGEVKHVPATPPYVLKNSGKDEIILYSVFMKR